MKHRILLLAACQHAFALPEIINDYFDVVATGDIELRGHEHQTVTLPWVINFENPDLKGLLSVHPSLLGKIDFVDAAFVVDGFNLHENRQLPQITIVNHGDEPLRIRVGTPLARVFVSGHSSDDELLLVAQIDDQAGEAIGHDLTINGSAITGDGSGIALPEIGDADTSVEIESIEPAIDVLLDQVDVAATIANTEGSERVLDKADTNKPDPKNKKRTQQ